MSLSNAAALADDDSPGGFQSRALATLIHQAALIVQGQADVDAAAAEAEAAAAETDTALEPDPTPPLYSPADLSMARQLLKNPLGFKVTCAWVLAGDSAVNASLSPSDATLTTAAREQWPFLVAIL